MHTRRDPEHGLRVSSLVFLVFGAALVLGALRSPTPAWSLAISEVTLAFLLFSLLASSFRAGRARAFWVGFAVLGWGRLAVGHAPWLSEFCEVPLRQALEDVGTWAYPNDLAKEFSEVGPKTLNLIRISNSLVILSFAALGGISCRSIARSRRLVYGGSRLHDAQSGVPESAEDVSRHDLS